MESNEVAEVETANEIKPKMHYTGKVMKISLAGALLEIGEGTPAVMHISQMVAADEQPIKRVEDVLSVGQEVEVWVKKIKDGRIEMTMIKPLDLEWRDIKKGMTVKGTVVRLEKFGAFVEIGAERPGLVHISEMAHGYVKQPSDVVKEGDEVEAEVLDVNRRKKQIKLSMKALQPEPVKVEEPRPTRTPSADGGPAREKPKRRPAKTGRKSSSMSDESAELLLSLNDNSEAEAEPTAMEIALREAMEKAKTRKQKADAKKKSTSQEQDDILSRTLEQKANN